MQFYSVRDFRTQPKQIWDRLAQVHRLIITNNGKPTALMIDIDDDNLEDVLSSVRQSMAMRAANRLRLDARFNGTSNLSEEEIQAEIEEARKARA